jgi:hypothetical protein
MAARSRTAPALMQNWTAYSQRGDGGFMEMLEFALYSDADFTTYLRRPDWPIDLLTTMPSFRTSGVRFALAARVRWNLAIPEVEPGTSKTDDSAYHGGGIDDEIAALVSLLFGVRCRSGGPTRRWWSDEQGGLADPLGFPMEFDHHPPAWAAPLRGHVVLPTLASTAALTDRADLLESVGQLSEAAAIALIRAARLYSNAIWVADSDPNLAWLQLVSAIEAVAVLHAATEPPWKRVEVEWPDLWEVLQEAGQDHAERVAAELADLVQSTSRFVNFLTTFMPLPPEDRPSEALQLDWTDLTGKLRKVYRYRSRALHDGAPFPGPMCEPPIKLEDGIPVEIPPWIDSRHGLSVWQAKDVPMYLHVFEYIARHAVLAWWESVVAPR